jgi:hypothetical protein
MMLFIVRKIYADDNSILDSGEKRMNTWDAS